jgi:hypothetical protein
MTDMHNFSSTGKIKCCIFYLILKRGIIMKQFRILFFLLLLFSTSSTSHASLMDKQVLIYKGESEHWSVISKVTIVENQVEHIETIKYKGKDIDSLGKVTYQLDSIAGSSGGTRDLSLNPGAEPGTIISRGGGGNIELVSKATTILTKVEWNNEFESFELKKQ